jgi:hypothetical protein
VGHLRSTEMLTTAAAATAAGERVPFPEEPQQPPQQRLSLGTRAAVAGAVALAVLTAVTATTCSSELAVTLLLLEVRWPACCYNYCHC